MQSLCQGKGQRSHKAKNRRKHFRGKIGRAISNLVAVLVFSTIGRHLECAIQTELVVELELALIERKQYRSILSYARTIRKGLRRLALCQGQRSCRAKNRKIQSKDLYCTISPNYTIPAPTVSVLMSTYAKFF